MKKSFLAYGILLFTLAFFACVKESEKNQSIEKNLKPEKAPGQDSKSIRPDIWYGNEQYCKLK